MIERKTHAKRAWQGGEESARRERQMVVMPSNNSGFEAGLLFGRHPGRLAHLMNPSGMREPHPEILWALDNGVYGAWQSGRPWSEVPFYAALESYHHHKPLWAVVPDVVANRVETLFMWGLHAEAVASFGVPLASAVQDGMTPDDVPAEADVVFVGGSVSWKWRTLRMWTGNFPRVHVGRVNTHEQLWRAHDAGAESCDGTGWFRGGPRRLEGLVRYLEESASRGRAQTEFDAI